MHPDCKELSLLYDFTFYLTRTSIFVLQNRSYQHYTAVASMANEVIGSHDVAHSIPRIAESRKMARNDRSLRARERFRVGGRKHSR